MKAVHCQKSPEGSGDVDQSSRVHVTAPSRTFSLSLQWKNWITKRLFSILRKIAPYERDQTCIIVRLRASKLYDLVVTNHPTNVRASLSTFSSERTCLRSATSSSSSSRWREATFWIRSSAIVAEKNPPTGRKSWKNQGGTITSTRVLRGEDSSKIKTKNTTKKNTTLR